MLTSVYPDSTVSAPPLYETMTSDYAYAETDIWTFLKNLSNENLNILQKFPQDSYHCMIEMLLKPSPPEPYCRSDWDSFQCWPAVSANTTVFRPCPGSMGFLETEHVAHRTCAEDGTWLNGNWTNYSACLDHVWTFKNETELIPSEMEFHWVLIIARLYFVASNISLVLLLITLFIFCYFRSLQCSRISIHKHLVFSFIIRFVLVVVIMEPYMTDRGTSYRDIDWLCKSLTSLLQYTVLANIFWMFVEGLFLHNRIVVSVFNSDAPFKLFYFIGWGIPLLITITWSVIMEKLYHKRCWMDYTDVSFIFIIYVPVMVVLGVNLIFLVNIIFVLVTKLRAHNTVETAQIRKAIRATVVLFPLLGITNLIFITSPVSEGPLKTAYHITNTILHSSQGIFVSVLYCFLNGEVRTVIKKKWRRFKISRSMNTRGRRRSSRTSSLFLSQSEVVLMVPFRNKMWTRRSKQDNYNMYSPAPNMSAAYTCADVLSTAD